MKGKMGEMARLAKQAKGLKSKVKKAEKELKKTIITGTDSKEQVKVNVDGKQQFRNITIDPELIAQNNAKALEKAIGEALDDALQRSQKISESTMAAISKDVQIPGMEEGL
jgi:DNA-binding YbaB/EbfC family protein